MNSGDILGEEGRKALNACVKVKILGRPKREDIRLYDRNAALERLENCYGNFPDPGSKRRLLELERGPLRKQLQRQLSPETSTGMKYYSIIDIYKALVSFDDIPYVEKYPANCEGPHYDKLKEFIDKRRADVAREVNEVTEKREEQHRYSWLVAQRRVRDCFAGNFPEDVALLDEDGRIDRTHYSIKEIYDSVKRCDNMSFQHNFNPQHQSISSFLYMSGTAEKKRENVDLEYANATSPADARFKPLNRYSRKEVMERLFDCIIHDDHASPHDLSLNHLVRRKDVNDSNDKLYSIFDICNALCLLDEKLSKMITYPSEGPGSGELKTLIDRCRDDVKREYQEGNRQCKYSRSEAERRVRDCFAGSFLINYTDVFAKKFSESAEVLKIDQTYNIFDIQKAIQYFDSKKLVDKYPEEEGLGADEKKKVDEERACIKQEYDEATAFVEVEHGSGFIIQDHFIITNTHVIESALNDKSNVTKILISNAALGKHALPCKIAHYDAGTDLALLYCPDLKIDSIRPLQLSDQQLLPGMQIFCFGFPISHTGDSALFVNGFVSGSKKKPEGHTVAVLNCALNCGQSGGPVLCWLEGRLKVLGVATQKHFKQILTDDEILSIEKIKEMLQTCVIPKESEIEKLTEKHKSAEDLPHFATKSLSLLTLKLYDALETHSQFNLSNALPGHQVIDFLKTSLRKYQGDYKNELAKVVETISTSEA